MNSNPQLRYRCHGFSLIELLVVLVIITLLAGTVSIALDFASPGSDRLQQSAERLGTSFALAQEEAVLANDHLGLTLTRGPDSEEGSRGDSMGHPLAGQRQHGTPTRRPAWDTHSQHGTPTLSMGHPLELRWLRYRSGQWHEVGAPLSSVPLYEGQSLTLAVDGEELPLQARPGPVQPFLLLDPSGVTEDFELRLQAAGGDEQFVLFVNERGVLEETWRQH